MGEGRRSGECGLGFWLVKTFTEMDKVGAGTCLEGEESSSLDML